MFDAVRFQSYKCLADVTIELGRMTLIVGANASGKSSVLDGLHLLRERGRSCGLTDFLKEVEDIVVPLLAGGSPREA